MKVLLYNQLNPKKIPNFAKTARFLETGDFRSADVKKLGPNLYGARLDITNRLLFSINEYQGEDYILVLEYIPQHAYDKSRFLRRGVTIDESKLPVLAAPEGAEAEPLTYVNPRLPTFNLLNKVISFDDAQQDVYAASPPFVVIGSAGSGKTALTLEKMKEARGEVLYVTRSKYLVHNSRDLYYALGYENDEQQVSFLSFTEYLASLRVPQGRELQFREFSNWFARHRAASKLKDPQQLFEEFKGVLTGAPGESPWLSLDEYLGLGIRQSIFAVEERPAVYDLFLKYLEFLRENGYYDANIISHEYLPLAEPHYDFIVVDEVQDVTTIQLQLILKSLNEPGQFILCGDANQIVHPNFFSWAKLKSFFYGQDEFEAPAEFIRILNSNYRNSLQVTEVANRILKLKTARFGSVDRESHYLVQSNAEEQGTVLLLPDSGQITGELNQKTRLSTRFAVIVMDPEQKPRAKDHFQTPLVFTVQEAKGLEYDNIILYNFASSSEERFREIARDVNPEDVTGAELRYGRAKDKSDKSLEIYKFYINSLYVAITRAVENLYVVESNPGQRLFHLLGLKPVEGPLELAEQDSSLETWRQEARKLELQGKEEQAEEIRSRILKIKEIPWDILKGDALAALERQALEEGNRKAKLLLFEYALVYQDGRYLKALAQDAFKPALRPDNGLKLLNQKYFFAYDVRKPDLMLREVDQFGVDFRNVFNQTPLMAATRLGNEEHVERLVELGANTDLVNNAGLNAFQMMLEQACVDPAYAAGKLETLYGLLEPQELVLQVDGRLVKLNSHSMEFLLLNLMIAMFYTCLGEKAAFGDGFVSADFMKALEPFPENIVPARRKVRAYITGILSKNEVERDDRYNRKLFLRIKHGNYIINPRLALQVEGEWRSIYELLSLDALSDRYRPGAWADDFIEEYKQRGLERFREFVAENLD